MQGNVGGDNISGATRECTNAVKKLRKTLFHNKIIS